MSLRPIPDDASADQVSGMLDAMGDDWWLTTPGDIVTTAVETILRDGSGWQEGIIFTLPLRRNHTEERQELRVFVQREYAEMLMVNLVHTCAWYRARDEKRNG